MSQITYDYVVKSVDMCVVTPICSAVCSFQQIMIPFDTDA